MSRRTERIGSLIRRILADEIRNHLSDPRIEPMTSITRVDVTEDLALARVHVSVLAPDARQRLCVHALQRASGRLRSAVARSMQTRQLPALEFLLDESLKRGFETVQLIERLVSPPGSLADANEGAGPEFGPGNPDEAAAGDNRPAAAKTPEIAGPDDPARVEDA